MANDQSKLRGEIISAYKQLKQFYEQLPRDPKLDQYMDQFSFTEVVEKIYAVGPYCWFISDMKNGRFVKIGGALKQMTGYKERDFLNDSFIKAARFTSAEHLAATLTAAGQFWGYFYSQPIANRRHIKSSHTYSFIRKDGSTFHALQQSSTVFFDQLGNGVYQFDLITDISHLDAIPKLRFFLMDTADQENHKNIPIHEGIIKHISAMPISAAEKKVLDLIVQGKSIKMIASELGLSENTIKHHRTSMFAKCEVKNMAELTAKALTNGWFSS
jgi:DNA-binding CsgD family transcriptional regulator